MSTHPASQRLEIIDNFVVVSVVTIVCIRGFLIATGFPQIGGHGAHIAHALWGALALTIALLISLLAERPNKPLLAILGGIGFGFFIDEVGKFVTASNNYFFSGSFYIIYMTLILIWLIARFIIVRQENRPFFVGAAWPKNPIDGSLVTLWAIAQVLGSIPLSIFFVLRHTSHPFIDGATCVIFVAYAGSLALALWYVWRGQTERGARMMQRSILFAITLLLPALYFEFATLASIGAVVSILVLIDLSEVSIRDVLQIRRAKS